MKFFLKSLHWNKIATALLLIVFSVHVADADRGDYSLSPNKKCLMSNEGNGYSSCASCGNPPSTDCAEVSCYSSEQRYYGETYGGSTNTEIEGNYFCTRSGWCITPDHYYVPSLSVTGGLCTVVCESIDLYDMNSDGTCKCFVPTCYEPDACSAGYVLSYVNNQYTCVQCPFVNGTSAPRGQGGGSYYAEITDCYAAKNTNYSDSYGTFQFNPECYYTK
ncbi:MAG: hypothetical protein LBJ73_02975 [Rickettsiales bacterium]|jgi:hypothetical protein|nr:hypothetical protein [Rickettsiales bacterium]